METLTRRQALAAVVIGGVGSLTEARNCSAETEPMRSESKDASPLAAAIEVFNERAKQNSVGKTQPPLTEDEVIAAVRWIDFDRKEPGVTDAEYHALRQVAETRMLPPGAELEVITEFQPDNRMVFTAWSVRVRMTRPSTGGSYGFVVRDQMLRSRLIGPEERKVIDKWEQKWRERGGIASFDRVPYGQERERAIERDRDGSH